ncbi:MAG: CinA family protein [Phyllobacterium sp.]
MERDGKNTLVAEDLAVAVLSACRTSGLMIATAESCTGGLIAAALTDISGSSDVVERGFVTYSNTAKHEMLGVPENMIATKGAVSKDVAIAMAEGALENSRADIAVAVTGVAGPSGGSETKPVGLVHLAVAYVNHPTVHIERRFGSIGREQIRHRTVQAGLQLILDQLADQVRG